MRQVKGKLLGVSGSAAVSQFSVFMLSLTVTACAGGTILSDPRTMTFKPVEFTPPEPDRVVLDNGMVVYLLEDQLRRCAILVAPSLEARDGNLDALPTVLLEALATGTPVVSTTVTGTAPGP